MNDPLLVQIAEQGLAMRKAQKEYLRERRTKRETRSALAAAKKAEHAFDLLLARYTQAQAELRVRCPTKAF